VGEEITTDETQVVPPSNTTTNFELHRRRAKLERNEANLE
jgi:hypothetical protein